VTPPGALGPPDHVPAGLHITRRLRLQVGVDHRLGQQGPARTRAEVDLDEFELSLRAIAPDEAQLGGAGRPMHVEQPLITPLPEVHRFGGDAGMALTHSHFNSSAKLFLHYEARAETTASERLSFSLANTSDLLQRALADEAEIWDVWQRLYAAVGENAIETTETLPNFEELSEQSPGLGDLIVSAQNANAACADSLRALVEGGVLTVGIRAWLTAVTTFEWNRFGLPDHPDALAAAIATILRQQQPDTFS